MKKCYFMIIISALFLLAGCGKEDSQANKNQVSTDVKTVKSKTDESKTIKLVVHNAADKIKWFREVAKNYEDTSPGIKIDIEAISGTSQNYCTKLQMMLKTDETIDIVYEDSFMLQSDVSAGLLAPINEIKEWNGWEKFYPSLRDSVTIDGNIYAVPVSTDVRGLFYSRDIFKKAGIKTPWQPKNWQDIIDTCDIIKKKVPDVTPITMQLSKAMGEGTSMNTLQMLLMGTENLLHKDSKWDLSSKGMLDSLNFIQKLVKGGFLPRMGILMNPQYNNIMQLDLAPKQQFGIILDGSWIAGGWFVNDKKTLEAYPLAKMPTEFGQKPGFVTMSGGWLLSVNKKSNNKDAALEFIKFALNKENVLKYVLDVNNLSVRRDVAEEPSYPEYLKIPTSFLNYAHFRPANAQYPMVSSNIATAVESVVTQTATPEQAIKELGTSTERILGKDAVSSN
jgi:multiple sugar transport system substrate-binding protein